MIKDDECLDDLQNGLFIIQKKNGFKFGIDAVLLSDFAKETRSKKTLDLCTGTGIVPLLLSAKTNTPENFLVLKYRKRLHKWHSAVWNITSLKIVFP